MWMCDVACGYVCTYGSLRYLWYATRVEVGGSAYFNSRRTQSSACLATLRLATGTRLASPDCVIDVHVVFEIFGLSGTR